MAIQNVVSASMLVPQVIQNTPLDGGLAMTPMQNNRNIFRGGNMAVSERMIASRDPVSQFGTETHIGKGAVGRVTREIMETSVENISKIMESDDEFEGSNTGDYSILGPTEFQQFNDRSFQTQQQMVANAYKYFGTYGVA